MRRVGEERAIISVRVWLGQTPLHGDHVPSVIEGKIPGNRPPGRPRAGMLDRVNEGWQLLRSGQEACLRSRTIRKDLPVGRSNNLLKSGNKRAFTSHFVFETEMMRYKARCDGVTWFRTLITRFRTDEIV